MKKRKAVRHVAQALLFLGVAEKLLDSPMEREVTEETSDARAMVRATRQGLKRMLRKLRGRHQERPQPQERGLAPGGE